MHFLKKASYQQIEFLSSSYKNFELYLSREDCNNFESIQSQLIKLIEERNILISAIHCPLSSNNCQSEDGSNYLSLCEVLFNYREQCLFFSICDFAVKLAKVQNASNKSDEIDEDDLNHTSNEAPRLAITVILHEGCQLNCSSTPSFICPHNKSNHYTDSLAALLKSRFSADDLCYLQIGIENLPPFVFNDHRVSELCHDALTLPENQTGVNIGYVIDFCHLIASYYIRNIKEKTLETYLSEQLKSYTHAPIFLFHLSNYNAENNMHGNYFSDSVEDNKLLMYIRDWCLHYNQNYGRFIPITLEVSGDELSAGQNLLTGESSQKFQKIMLAWSQLHILFQDRLNGDLLELFSLLYQLFTDKDDLLRSNAKKHLDEFFSQMPSTPPFGLSAADFEVNECIELLPIKAYVIYMRLCNLALDLYQKYPSVPGKTDFFSDVLQYYIFKNELGQIRYNGLVGAYHMPWIMSQKAVTLYHINDNYNGNLNPFDSFEQVVSACCKHITDPSQPDLGFLSCSKALGRCLVKYFNNGHVVKNGTDGKIVSDDSDYTLAVIQVPLNCILRSHEFQPLQQFSINGNYIDSADNFCIDFSEFYHNRGDKNLKSASLFEVFDTLQIGVCTESIGSIYDKEVILKNYKNVTSRKYLLTEEQIIHFMDCYQKIMKNFSKQGSDFQKTIQGFHLDPVLEDLFLKIDFAYEQLNPYSLNNNSYFNNNILFDCLKKQKCSEKDLFTVYQEYRKETREV